MKAYPITRYLIVLLPPQHTTGKEAYFRSCGGSGAGDWRDWCDDMVYYSHEGGPKSDEPRLFKYETDAEEAIGDLPHKIAVRCKIRKVTIEELKAST